MGNKPKGFGQTRSTKSKKSQQKPQTPPVQKSIELHPLPDCEFTWQKEARLSQIFADAPTIPDISTQRLEQYYEHLNGALNPTLPLKISEPLPWEVTFVYGASPSQAHQQQRQNAPSYLDHYQFVAIHPCTDISIGIEGEVTRISDQQNFTVPLHCLSLDRQGLTDTDSIEQAEAQATLLSDYRLWWEGYQPRFGVNSFTQQYA